MQLRRLLLPLLLLLSWHASAQDETPGFRDVVRFGVFGGPQFNFHSGTYEALDQNALCGICDFENGDLMKFRFEALLEIPFTPSIMGSARIGWQDFSGQFDRDGYYVGQVAQPTGPPVDMIVDQTFDNALSYLVFTPGILYFPMEAPLHLDLGVGLAFPMSKDYTLREELVSPAGITFSDGTRDHVIRDEEIQEVNGFRLALELGAGYDIPLTRNLLLTPALAYSLPLTHVTGRGEWSASALAAGLGLRWAMIPPEKPAPPPPPPPPPPPEKIAPLAVSLNVSGLDPDGGSVPATSITVEELRTVERYPLLTYVFFAENEASQPLRQDLLSKERAQNFTVDDATGQELEIYRNMLNVVGRRLKDKPSAKITLTGTNADFGVEKGAQDLSRKRAETVKSYLTDIWGIDAKRITVRARDLPIDPSAIDDPRGQEENRRVEITSSDEDVIGPIRRDQIEYNASLAGLVLEPRTDAPNGIERWILQVRQGAKTLFEKEGRTGPPDASYTMEISGDAFKRASDPLDIRFGVRDRKAQDESVREEVAINTLTLERKREERIGDVSVNRSKLILFDFDKATVSDRNRAIVREVTKSITPKSSVSIVGYTDALGEAEYNVKLSEQRADAVRKSFGKALENIDVTTRGVGSTQLLFPNDTPEGRFYCRMVQVIIETPVTE